MSLPDGAALLKAHTEQMRKDFPPQPCAQCAALRAALEDILAVIEADELIPESVSYMRQARAALLTAPPQPVTS